MAIPKDVPQDDYYAQVKTAQSSDDGTKKPLKLKLKAVVKKPTDSDDIIPLANQTDTESQNIITQKEDTPVSF